VGVATDDGVRLHVEEDGPTDAPVTVVFSHGFTANLGEWVLQRAALRDRARLVFYDQRGHGRSADGGWRRATIDQLGRDLQAVLTATCPTGPVVLVGHSMGGMALMSWARQFPAEVGDRVLGAFLLSTAAGELVQTGPLGHVVRLLTRLRLLGLWLTVLRWVAPALERSRKRGTKVGRRYVRHYLFGRGDRDDAALVTMVQELLEATPLTTSAAFYPTFLTHDERAGLPVLAGIPTTVLCGTDDRLTPHRFSQAMASALGIRCELVLVPAAGHSVNVTRPELVDAALHDLLDRSLAAGRVVTA